MTYTCTVTDNIHTLCGSVVVTQSPCDLCGEQIRLCQTVDDTVERVERLIGVGTGQQFIVTEVLPQRGIESPGVGRILEVFLQVVRSIAQSVTLCLGEILATCNIDSSISFIDIVC